MCHQVLSPPALLPLLDMEVMIITLGTFWRVQTCCQSAARCGEKARRSGPASNQDIHSNSDVTWSCVGQTVAASSLFSKQLSCT